MSGGPKFQASRAGFKVCSRCREEKPLTTEFWVIQRSKKSGWASHCKTCKNEWHKAHYQEYKDVKREYATRYQTENRKKIRLANKKRNLRRRFQCLHHYSRGAMCCSCIGCHENHLEFLTLDHINGGGNKHRKEAGNSLVNWLIRNNYPEGFRVLCMNCNHALGLHGYCPHERE